MQFADNLQSSQGDRQAFVRGRSLDIANIFRKLSLKTHKNSIYSQHIRKQSQVILIDGKAFVDIRYINFLILLEIPYECERKINI